MEKIVHKEVIKEVTVGVSEEELSKVRGRVVDARRRRADCLPRRSTPRRNGRRRRSGNGPSASSPPSSSARPRRRRSGNGYELI